MSNPVIIVGAGLSGLYAASLLSKNGIEYRVLEARERTGGRVLSIRSPHGNELNQYDLGPTWFWPKYEKTIVKLVQDLNLQIFEQYTEGAMLLEHDKNAPPKRSILPESSMEKSMRFKGGVHSLIKALEQTLQPNTVELETRVTAINLI